MGKRAVRGEGRPYRRTSDGLWVAVVRDAEGRRKYLYGSSPDAVVERRDEYLAGASMGLSLASTRLTVGRQLADWLEDRRGKVRPSTWIFYESHVRIHLATLNRIPLTKLRPADIRRVVRERELAGCSPRTVSYSLIVLRMAIRQAQRDGLVARNVAEAVAAPRQERSEVTILTVEEARHLLATVPDDTYGRLWTVLLGTGMRLGEALGLRRGDVDLARGRVAISVALRPVDRRMRAEGEARLQLTDPKTSTSRRTIAIPAFVVEALRAELALEGPRNVDGLLFVTPAGTAIDQRNVYRRWIAYRESAGLPPIRMHDLRHTATSFMLAQGASLHDVMKALGHASIAQTANTYGHLVEGRSREIADGMDRALGGAS